MFSLIKQVFIVLLSFSISLATKCMFLNDEPCMFRTTHVALNPVELKYYTFMINLDKSFRSYLQKYVSPKERKDINIKAFDMIINKSEAKAMKKTYFMWL